MVTQQQKSFKILVIGEICRDIFVYGKCDRLSPEAPVPVLDRQVSTENEGMAANVSKNLKGLGNKVVILGNEQQITKMRFVDERSNQHLLRVDSISNKIQPFDIDHIDKLSDDFYAVIISDYDKGFLPRQIMFELLIKIRRKMKGIKIFIDSKKKNLKMLKNCTIKINEKEFNAAKDTIHKSNTIIKTIGKRGAECNGVIYPSDTVDVFDVVGAGDTFIAGYVTKFLETGDIPKSIKFANKCASFVVTKLGTYALQLSDIQK